MDFNFDDFIQKTMHYGELFGFRILQAVIVMTIGYVVAKLIRYKIRKIIKMRSDDAISSNFLEQAASVAILIVTIITVLGIFGVPTTSIVAAIGTMGIAIALSLKDSLSSVASGIILIILRPYKKDDFVEIGSVSGNILSVNLFTTHIATQDGKIVILPNKNITSSAIINSGRGPLARVEIIINIGYESNVELAKQCVSEILENTKEVLQDKSKFIGVTDLNIDGVNMCIRFWIDRNDGVFATKSKVIEVIKSRLDENHIKIPHNN